jgi:hypothetical protein
MVQFPDVMKKTEKFHRVSAKRIGACRSFWALKAWPFLNRAGVGN